MINFGFGVSLDSLKEESLKILLTWRNDFKIWKTCRQNDLLTWDSHHKWFESLSNNPKVKMYGIVRPAGVDHESVLVGVCGLTDIDLTNRRAEFSLYIGPENQRRGYAAKALKTLISHGFSNLNLNCVWGETFKGNPAAGMFEAIGMEKEGTRKQFYFREGKYIDADLYSVLASEWPYKEQV